MLWHKICKEHGFATERDMFSTWYETERLSIKQIATKLQVGTNTVQTHLESLGIERRPRGGDNCKIDQAYKMFHLDQRVVLTAPAKQLHKLIRVSYTYLYKFQRRRAPNGVLHYYPDSGVNNLRDTQQMPLTAAANSAS